MENDNEENDDNVIVEDIIKAHSNPGQAFVPMNREVDEDRDLKELCLLIISKKELVAKLRDRSPGFLSNQPRSNPVIWDQAEDTSLNWSITRLPKYGLIFNPSEGLLFHRSSIIKGDHGSCSVIIVFIPGKCFHFFFLVERKRYIVKPDHWGSNSILGDRFRSFGIHSDHSGSMSIIRDQVRSSGIKSDHLVSNPIIRNQFRSLGINSDHSG